MKESSTVEQEELLQTKSTENCNSTISTLIAQADKADPVSDKPPNTTERSANNTIPHNVLRDMGLEDCSLLSKTKAIPAAEVVEVNLTPYNSTINQSVEVSNSKLPSTVAAEPNLSLENGK